MKMGRSTTTPSSHPHETLSVALLKAVEDLKMYRSTWNVCHLLCLDP